MPALIWAAAALAMVYVRALPECYDIACGAHGFTTIVTLAVSGEHSAFLLAARAWETLISGALGLAAAMLILQSKPVKRMHVGKARAGWPLWLDLADARPLSAAVRQVVERLVQMRRML